jgi:hypothetical protein
MTQHIVTTILPKSFTNQSIQIITKSNPNESHSKLSVKNFLLGVDTKRIELNENQQFR